MRGSNTVRQKMKHWITAAVTGLVLAFAGPRMLEAIHPGSDDLGVFDSAVSVSLSALLPSLVIGWFSQRFGRRKDRFLSALVAVVSVVVLLSLIVGILFHRWLWEVGMLIVVPLAVCGLPLAYLIVTAARNRPNQSARPSTL